VLAFPNDFFSVIKLLGIDAAVEGSKLRERLHSLRYGIACVFLVCGFLLTSNASYFICRRFVWLLGGFLPLALPPLSRRWSYANLGAVALCTLAITVGAFQDGLGYARQTECLQTLSAAVPRPGRLLWLIPHPTPVGYAAPVNNHLGAYISANQGGVPFFEFAQTGIHAMRPRNVGALPEMNIMALHGFPDLYRPEFATRFDTILTMPAADPDALLGADRSHWRSMTCGDFELFHRSRDR